MYKLLIVITGIFIFAVSAGKIQAQCPDCWDPTPGDGDSCCYAGFPPQQRCDSTCGGGGGGGGGSSVTNSDRPACHSLTVNSMIPSNMSSYWSGGDTTRRLSSYPADSRVYRRWWADRGDPNSIPAPHTAYYPTLYYYSDGTYRLREDYVMALHEQCDSSRCWYVPVRHDMNRWMASGKTAEFPAFSEGDTVVVTCTGNGWLRSGGGRRWSLGGTVMNLVGTFDNGTTWQDLGSMTMAAADGDYSLYYFTFTKNFLVTIPAGASYQQTRFSCDVRLSGSGTTCTWSPPSVCPDTYCTGGETCATCPQDCGFCTGDIEVIYFDKTQRGNCTNLSPRVDGVNVSITHNSGGTDPSCSSSASGTTSSGSFTASSMCAGPTNYQVTATSMPSPYVTPPSTYCNGSSYVTVNDGATSTIEFGLTAQYDSWFQVQGSGNVQAKTGDIQSLIPPTCTGSCDSNFIVDPSGGGDPGVVTYGGSSYDFSVGSSAGNPSSTGWIANSGYSGQHYGYQLVFNQLGFSDTSPNDFGSFNDVPKPIFTPASSTAYFADTSIDPGTDTMTITSPWQVNTGEQIVILVNGNLSIQNQIQVDPGGFLAFFVSGDITIDPSVGNGTGNPDIEGIFISEGTISTGTLGSNDARLILEGTYVGWGGVNLERQLPPNDNRDTPAELFIYRPDFIEPTIFPGFLNQIDIDWQEVAP